MFALVIGDAMFFYKGNEIPLGVSTKCRFTEVGIVGNITAWLNKVVGEVAATAARHQDFLANFIAAVQY